MVGKNEGMTLTAEFGLPMVVSSDTLQTSQSRF